MILAATIHFDWGTFWQYAWPPNGLKDPLIRNGFAVTIGISIGAQSIGCVLGVLAALMRLAPNRPLRWLSIAYTTYFRGTPTLVQLALIYFGISGAGLYSYPDLHVGGFIFSGALQAGMLGLGINEGAYMAEIVRAAILSVDPGQAEAAKAIGMTPRLTMVRIVFPQALRIIIPPLGNEFNNMMKQTTLLVWIGVTELFNGFEQINAAIFQPFEVFLAAALYYIELTILWTLVQRWIEGRVRLEKPLPGTAIGPIQRLVGWQRPLGVGSLAPSPVKTTPGSTDAVVRSGRSAELVDHRGPTDSLPCVLVTMGSLATLYFNPHVFWKYLWPLTAFQNPLIRDGFIVTLYMAVAAMFVGVLLGTVIGIGRLSKRSLVRLVSLLYITYFRGTPQIIQLFIIYFGTAALGLYQFPTFSLGPLRIAGLVQAGILGLGCIEAAFMAEIVRAGVMSIDPGQTEAARAIGMTPTMTMRRIILPQAVKAIIPPFGNDFISMFKATTLVVILGGVELFSAYQAVNAVLFDALELYLAVSMYYLAISVVWMLIQGRLEARVDYGRGIAIARNTLFRRLA